MTTRPRGFIEWNPRADTLALIDAVKNVLIEYREVMPLTVRQVFYRLVAECSYEKTEQAYSRLTEIISKARRARLIPMDNIRDDGFFLTSLERYAETRDVVDNYRHHAANVRLDRQSGQDRRLTVWCEAQGMKPMLEAVAADFGVAVASSGGFDSLTTKYEMARAFSGAAYTEVLHVGDHDPSGVHMFSSLEEDIAAFIGSMGGKVKFTRLAVTPEQRDSYRLPTAPPKKTDRRKFEDSHTVQCEALQPDVLQSIVRDAITDRLNMDTYRVILSRERLVREELREFLRV